MFWTALKKEFFFGISASFKIGPGSQFYLYIGYFTGLLYTGFEGKQGKYVKPLWIEHKLDEVGPVDNRPSVVSVSAREGTD